jgi:ABC-type microcin C transport system permease subunit YejB
MTVFNFSEINDLTANAFKISEVLKVNAIYARCNDLTKTHLWYVHIHKCNNGIFRTYHYLPKTPCDRGCRF